MLQILALGEYLSRDNGSLTIPLSKRPDSSDISGYAFRPTYIKNEAFKKFCKEQYQKYKNDKNVYEDVVLLVKYNTSSTELTDDEKYKYWEKFLDEIYKVYNIGTSTKVDKQEEVLEKSLRSVIDIKTSIYYTLKILYDKWLCSINYGKYSYQSLTKSVKYCDTLQRNIENDFYFDIGTLAKQITAFYSKENDKKSDVISFMGKMAQDNNCNFIALPDIASENLEDIFKAQPFSDIIFDRQKSNTRFIVMHNSDVSHHLNDDKSDYFDDGFDIANYYGDIDSNGFAGTIANEVDIKAFGVTYGMQNQNIFKSVSVDTSSPSVTDYSIANTLMIAEGGSDTVSVSDTSFKQTSLYPVYANRSYNCSVSMMGCMNIRPLMFFQLNNIPLFRGAYIITGVEHMITPNDFTTTFKGVRVSKYMVPYIDEVTSQASIRALFDIRREKPTKFKTATSATTENEESSSDTPTKQYPSSPPVNSENDIVNLDPTGLYWKAFGSKGVLKGHEGKNDCWKSGRYAMFSYFEGEGNKNNYKEADLGENTSVIQLLTHNIGSNDAKLHFVTTEGLSMSEKYDLTINCIKFHLACNAPIMIGVNHHFFKNGHSGKGEPNTEGTDHFVVIYAYFKNEKGQDCFRYYETGRNPIEYAFQGTSTCNNYVIYEPGDSPRFYINNSCRNLRYVTPKSDRWSRYDVTQVRPYLTVFENTVTEKGYNRLQDEFKDIRNFEYKGTKHALQSYYLLNKNNRLGESFEL
jgi:hypothetical protein